MPNTPAPAAGDGLPETATLPKATRRTLLAGAATLAAGELAPFVRPAHATAAAISDAALLALGAEYHRSLEPAKAAHLVHGPLEAQFFAIVADRASETEREQLSRSLGLPEAKEAIDKAESATFAIITKVSDTPATTLAGLRVKAVISAAELNMVPELLDSLVDDLLRMEA